jgi:Eco29kI restriction endonuclease
MGYAEFELDIPEVMRQELPKYFDQLSSELLTLENISEIPANAQGAYMLFLRETLVYIGKTDAEAGFRNRLTRHLNNVQHRKNLDPGDVRFKAVRIFVFSNFDLETMLIKEYEKRFGRPIWNFSGFGSNDPGRNRESQTSAKFDCDYPVDIDRRIDFIDPGEYELLRAILELKSGLPYLFRYDTQGRHYRHGHPEMESKKVTIPIERTTRTILEIILSSLPLGWQATVLPNRVILYKEKQDYAEQVEVLRRSL